MGRYQSFRGNDERVALHRPGFRGTVQNGILAEASTDPSPGVRSARQVERTVPLSPARRLVFLRAGIVMESNRTGGKQFCTSIYGQRLGNLELKRNLAGIHSGTHTQPS